MLLVARVAAVVYFHMFSLYNSNFIFILFYRDAIMMRTFLQNHFLILPSELEIIAG